MVIRISVYMHDFVCLHTPISGVNFASGCGRVTNELHRRLIIISHCYNPTVWLDEPDKLTYTLHEHQDSDTPPVPVAVE